MLFLYNYTIKELHNYCKNKNINVNKNIIKKEEIINYIFLNKYFNLLKKVIKSKNIYYIRLLKEIKNYKHQEYGSLVFIKENNTLKFSNDDNLTILIPDNYPFKSPTITKDDIEYTDIYWSPAKKLSIFLNEYFKKDDIFLSKPNSDIIQQKILEIKKSLGEFKIEFIEYQNDYYDSAYVNYKKYIFDKKKYLGNEMFLFHGTNKNDLDSILSNDFSLTSHIRHGSVYGKGIYFTNSIKFAMKYSGQFNEKYVLLVYTYVGDIVEGRKYPNILPKMPGCSYYYDTAVDSLSNPNQFIKKKKS